MRNAVRTLGEVMEQRGYMVRVMIHTVFPGAAVDQDRAAYFQTSQTVAEIFDWLAEQVRGDRRLLDQVIIRDGRESDLRQLIVDVLAETDSIHNMPSWGDPDMFEEVAAKFLTLLLHHMWDMACLSLLNKFKKPRQQELDRQWRRWVRRHSGAHDPERIRPLIIFVPVQEEGGDGIGSPMDIFRSAAAGGGPEGLGDFSVVGLGEMFGRGDRRSHGGHKLRPQERA